MTIVTYTNHQKATKCKIIPHHASPSISYRDDAQLFPSKRRSSITNIDINHILNAINHSLITARKWHKSQLPKVRNMELFLIVLILEFFSLVSIDNMVSFHKYSLDHSLVCYSSIYIFLFWLVSFLKWSHGYYRFIRVPIRFADSLSKINE